MSGAAQHSSVTAAAAASGPPARAAASFAGTGGGWKPGPNADAVVAYPSGDTALPLLVQDDDGMNYWFTASGQLKKVESVTDPRHPASPPL